MSAEGEVSITDAIKEVLPFLDVLTPTDYKLKILEHILGMTGTKDGINALPKISKFIDVVMDLICNDTNDVIHHECVTKFVNITSTNQSNSIMQKILEEYFIEYLLKIVLIPESDAAESVSMLLTNMTQAEDNAKVVAKFFINENDISIDNYVNAFCNENYHSKCQVNHMGSFLANLTALKEIRDMLLKDNIALLKKIFPFTQYEKSIARRLAVATIIKNCLFETEYHEEILCEDVDILPHLLLPLAGPEELSATENEELPLDLQYLAPDKEREKNKEVQLLLIDCLFQLCATKDCRLKMKANGSYYILREFFTALSDHDDVLVPLENLIQVLIGDEPDKGMENLKEIEIPDNIVKELEEINK